MFLLLYTYFNQREWNIFLVDQIISLFFQSDHLYHYFLSIHPENIRKSFVFWLFLGGKERDQWHEIGWSANLSLTSWTLLTPFSNHTVPVTRSTCWHQNCESFSLKLYRFTKYSQNKTIDFESFNSIKSSYGLVTCIYRFWETLSCFLFVGNLKF